MFEYVAGSGNTERRIGDDTFLSTITDDDCARACWTLKKTDGTINGVTVRRDGTAGCWCQMGLKTTKPSITYKTCKFTESKFLLFTTVPSITCKTCKFTDSKGLRPSIKKP